MTEQQSLDMKVEQGKACKAVEIWKETKKTAKETIEKAKEKLGEAEANAIAALKEEGRTSVNIGGKNYYIDTIDERVKLRSRKEISN
jgi:uncharacterized protein YqfA (UPF0365 family)